MRRSLAVILFLAVMGLAGNAQSVPTLQVGAPGASGEGTYADYQKAAPLPSAGEDTAVTSGDILYVGGLLGQHTVYLGGQRLTTSTSGDNWSSFCMPTAFDGHGAILVASVPEGTLETALASLRINGTSAFYRSATESYFPNNHDPLKPGISDFLFFDLGVFAGSTTVPDFDTEAQGSAKALGQIKTLTLSGMDKLDWIHFDVMALATDAKGKTQLVFNPGSHDVSWQPASSVSAPASVTVLVPETSTVFLLGLGLLGLYGYRLRRRRNA